ncbi:fasciclin-2-like isoform X2 [Leptidea sinapis]|nr:fasciclin-2-like isoform X2 [Leptidea sinapis]
MIIENYCIIVTILVSLSTVPECHACFASDLEAVHKIRTGSTFYLECRCDDPTSSRISLKWLDTHDKEIQPSGPGTKSNVYTEWWDEITYSLYITNISKSISGAYKCVTEYNGREYSRSYTLEAYDLPYFVNTDATQYVVSGSDALINCKARGETDPLISWHKDHDEPIEIIDANRYEISSQGLLIRNITDDDNGIYKCTASDVETGEEIDKNIVVKVITKPVINELVAIPDNVAYKGASVALDCSANGIPSPTFKWRKVLKDENIKTNITWVEVVNRIVFDSIAAEDRGIYECTASNTAGNVTEQIELKVLVPPVILEFDNITATEGSTVQIACKARGLPTPKINLLYLGEEPEDQRIVWSSNNTSEIETEFYLTFLQVNRSHEGSYICNATNDVESVYSEMFMTVYYKPYFNKPIENIWGWSGNPVNLTCDYESNPPSNISWRYQGTSISTEKQLEINRLIVENENKVPVEVEDTIQYGIYECTAENDYGEAKKIIVFLEGFAPPPVKNVTVLNVTATSATFNIDGPEEITGPPIVGFTSEYDVAENFDVTNIHINRTWSLDRPYRINKLRPNSSYFIRFAAVNDVGGGAWSDFIEFVTLEKSTPDEPIWDNNADFIQSGVLKWKETEDNGEPIEFYILKYCQVSNGTIQSDLCQIEILKLTTEYELSQLQFNKTYYFELIAQNSLGNSSVASAYIDIPAVETSSLTAGGIIGIAVVIVIICLVLLDLLVCAWKKQGVIATCAYKKKNNKRDDTMNSR